MSFCCRLLWILLILSNSNKTETGGLDSWVAYIASSLDVIWLISETTINNTRCHFFDFESALESKYCWQISSRQTYMLLYSHFPCCYWFAQHCYICSFLYLFKPLCIGQLCLLPFLVCVLFISRKTKLEKSEGLLWNRDQRDINFLPWRMKNQKMLIRCHFLILIQMSSTVSVKSNSWW